MTEHSEQPQLTAGDELELELRARLVKLEQENKTLAAICAATAVIVLLLIVKSMLQQRNK